MSRWALLPSRFDPPAARPTDVRRHDLIEALQGTSTRLVSVIAPAGYGKSTLLAQYVEVDERPSAWMTVSVAANERTTLARYLLVALSAVTSIPRELVRELDAVRPQSALVTAGLATMIRRAQPFNLVIDDAHLLYDRRCIELVRALLAEVPEDARMIVVARYETSFGLAKERATGELFELGADELRLSVDDAGVLLRNAGAIDLTDDEIVALTEQTEGWAVSLYLAARSRLADRPSPPRPFSGDDRYIADYLRDVMLADVAPDRVDFLLQTSVLEELTGPLCDAALDITGSSAMLQELEGSNLLVVPLDQRRERYRYHHLFRSMLRTEFEVRTPDLIGPVTARASAWCEEQGWADLAISYAMAGRDVDRVAELIARNAQAAYYGGRATFVRMWFEWLGAFAPIERYPAVAVLGTWLMMLDGRAADAERWADAAARVSKGLDREFEGARALASAMMCRAGPDAMLADGERGMSLIAPQSSWRTAALILTGLGLLVTGRRDEAEVSLERAVEVGTESGDAFGQMVAHTECAILALERGDLAGASHAVSEARRVIDDASLRGYPGTTLTCAVDGRVRLVQGDPVRARRCLEEAVGIVPGLTYAVPILALQAHLNLARCAIGLGSASLAERFFAHADDVVAHRPLLGTLIEELAAAHEQLVTLKASGIGLPSLTQAEARLLPLLTTHLSFREIGERLFISPHTVKTQAISIYRKLGVTSRTQAVDAARELGLLTR